ncbi:MAG: hypothetical protein ACK5MA_02310 [Parachlamydiaceae bacterium]
MNVTPANSCFQNRTQPKSLPLIVQTTQCLAMTFFIYETFTIYNDPLRPSSEALPIPFYATLLPSCALYSAALVYHFRKISRTHYNEPRLCPDPSILTLFAIAGVITAAVLMTTTLNHIYKEGNISHLPDPERFEEMYDNQPAQTQATIFTSVTGGLALFMGVATCTVRCERKAELNSLPSAL